MHRARRVRLLALAAISAMAVALTACSALQPAHDAAPMQTKPVAAAPAPEPDTAPPSPPETAREPAAATPVEKAPQTAPPTLPPAAPETTQGTTSTQTQPDAPVGEAPPPAATSTTEPSTADGTLETARESVRASTEWLARGVDSWFGDVPFENGGKVSDGRLSLAFVERQREGLETKVRFNVRLRLPNAEKRAYLFVGSEDQRDVVADTPGALARQQQLLAETPAEQSFFAGLGVTLRDAIDLRLGFQGIKPYLQTRYRKQWAPIESDSIEFRQTVFWRLHDHLGATTALSYEHALSSSLALRWLNAATITQNSEHFDWSSLLGTYKSYGELRVLALELLASGRLGDAVALSNYGAQTKWQQPVYRDWLLGEVTLGRFWPRADATSPRLESWAVGAALTMRF